MSELNIDTLTSAELKDQAKVLGIPLTGNPKDETIRERIREALGEPAKANETQAQPIAAEASEKLVKIMIQESESDQQPVAIGLNGRIIRIQRGKEVDVPAGYVEILRNAKQKVRDTKTNEDREVLSYPFQVLS